MKKLLAILLLVPAMVFGQELATYSIDMKIDGMMVPGQAPGVGDRNILFQMVLDPEDLEAANEIWYGHLKYLLGPEDVEELRAWAQEMSRQSSRR